MAATTDTVLRELSDDELRSIVEEGGASKRATDAAKVLDERGVPKETEPDPDEMVVSGTTQLSMFDFGGKKATHATFKLVGGKVKIAPGQAFKKGERVRGTFEGVINFVGQKDEHDSTTGQVTDAEQRHEARLTDIQVERAG